MNQQGISIHDTETEMLMEPDLVMMTAHESHDDQAGKEQCPPNFCWDPKRDAHVNEEFVFAALSLDAMKRSLKKGFSESMGKRVRHETRFEPMFFVDHGSTAILDTGASKSVIGKKRLEQLMATLPDVFAKKIAWQKSNTIFRFGNNGTLASLGAVFIPFGERWLKLEVVDGATPFLLSNAFLKAVAADICTSKQVLCMFHGRVSVPLAMSEKGVFLVDLVEILTHAENVKVHGESWEVVTHSVDETQNGRTTETKCLNGRLQQHNTSVAAAHQASSIREQAPSSTTQDGAQEDECSLCSDRGHGCTFAPPGGCHLVNAADGQQGGDCQATGGDYPQGVGRAEAGGRQTCWQDLCTDPGHRRELCRVHEEEGRLHVCLGPELSQLREGHGSDGPAHLSGTTAGVDALDDPEGAPRLEPEWGDRHRLGHHRRVEGQGQLGSPVRDHVFGKWVDQCQTWTADQRDHPEDECRLGAGDTRASAPNSDADRNSAEGTVALDASRGCIEPPIEKLSYDATGTLEDGLASMDTPINKFFDQELANLNLVEKIEHQLAVLAAHSADIQTRQFAPRTTNSKERLDILEVYCFPDSQLTRVANHLGLKAKRFTLQDGDLRTAEGQASLWKIIDTHRPRHIWASPDCKLWGNFARRNMGRSLKMRERILEGRKQERPNLCLCEEMYWYQVQHGSHFHLEQPVGSELPLQPELEQTRYGTLTTVFDMCELGLNWKGDPPQKRSVVLTTSRCLHDVLDSRYCSKGHTHRQIEGQVKHLGKWLPLSTFAAKYTAGFARKVISVVQKFPEEPPLLQDELRIGPESDVALIGEAIKRRRLLSKQNVHPPENPDSIETDEHRKSVSGERLKELFRELEKLAPRVGSIVLEGDSQVFKKAQTFCSFQLKHAEVCRGTERMRIPKAGTSLQDLKLRKTFSMCRSTGRIQQVGDEEEWTNLTQRQKIRKGIPSRLTLTLFGHHVGDMEVVPEESVDLEKDILY